MKKIVSLVIVFVALFSCASAEPSQSPETTAGTIKLLLSAGDTEADSKWDCSYLLDKDLFVATWVSPGSAEVAVAAAGGKNADAWESIKGIVYGFYESARTMLDAYGYEDSGLYFVLHAVKKDGSPLPYYAIGETDGAKCGIILDAITNDTAPVISGK